VADGDAREAEFLRVMRTYGPALARLAASYEAVASRREELLQEIALALWAALPRFRGACSERTFVYRVAHNRSLDHVWRRPPRHQTLEELPPAAHPPDPRPWPDETAAAGEQRGRLLRALQGLPVGHRQVLTLLLEDLSQAEIAEVLGITENNVAVRLNRARHALREALGGRS
jgi:RNA polymerase sigma-70 factor (ECF subfamily)